MTYLSEDKQLICDRLLEAIRSTAAGRDVVHLWYKRGDRDDDTVIMQYLNGHRITINVACDSGAAMIRDIMKEVR